jgi:DNA-binding LacI/PurR family transcriptional regulator
VAQDPSAVGVSAARQLIARVDPEHNGDVHVVDRVVLPTRLVERGTTGPVHLA